MSNPQEKAKELVEKFMSYSYFSDGNNSMNRQYQQEDNAKQCALIAVNEILKNNCGSYTDESNATNNEIYCDEYYWQEVKEEIELL
jgi:hypothetical protein